MSAGRKLSFLYVLNVAGLSLGLLTVPWAAYYLGMHEMGRFAYGSSAYLLAALIIDMSTDTWLIGKLARDPRLQDSANRQHLRDTSSLRMLMLLAVIGTLGVLMLAFSELRPNAWVFAACLLPAIAAPLGTVALTRITGHQMTEAVSGIGWRLCAAGAVIVAIPLWPVAETFALISGVSSLGHCVTVAWRLRREGLTVPFERPSFERSRRALRQVRNLSIGRYFGSVYTHLPPYVLGFWAGTDAAGVWQVADRFLRAGVALFAPLTSLLYPKLAAQTDGKRFVSPDARRLLCKSATAYGALALAMAAGLTGLAALVHITGLLDARITPVLAVFGATLLVLGASRFYSNAVLLPCLDFRAILLSQVAGACVFIIAAPVLSHLFSATGMAWAYTGAEGTVLAIYMLMARRHFPAHHATNRPA